MKYLTLILLIIFSVLVYKNKDYLAQYTEGGLATVLSSVGDNYVEPKIDFPRIKSSIEKATSTSMRSQNESKSFSQPKSYSFFPVVWNFYLNNKFWYNTKHSFQAYSPQTFYFTDESWKSWQDSGFYLGTKINNDSYLNKSKVIGNISINGPTELNTYFQYCAKPFPEHVYFKDINALERKFVQFANNKGDKNLKIGAKGEVAALAIEYENGGVCAQFIDGCLGGVTCSLSDRKNFLNQYQEKSIKNVFDYHTHDLNTGTAASKDFREYFIKDGRKFITAIPSSDDFGAVYLTKSIGEHKILGVVDIVDKVISPNGEGYIYDLPINEKSKKIFGTEKSSWKYNNDLINSVKKVLAKSIVEDKRTEVTNKDVIVIQDYLLKKYKDDFGATYKQFWVK